jgi:anti-anti-sigma regulatory factor
VNGDLAITRIVGRANFTVSVHLKTLVQELMQRGFRRFQFELSECVLMDSTFLGVLTGIAVQARGTGAETPRGEIQLLNPNGRITELLENLGVAHLFEILKGDLPAAAGTRLEPQADPAVSKVEIAQTCLEAHRTLANVNPENVAKFKDVMRFFEEDLKRLKAGG